MIILGEQLEKLKEIRRLEVPVSNMQAGVRMRMQRLIDAGEHGSGEWVFLQQVLFALRELEDLRNKK